MMRVLFQPLSGAQANALAHTRDELRAQEVESEVSDDPQLDLSAFALIHFFGCEPIPLALRCAFNAMALHKPFVITPFFSSHALKSSPTPEMEIRARAFERAALQFILHHAARVFPVAPEESDALVNTFELSTAHVLPASADAYAKTYRELARRSEWEDRSNELTLRALEDLTIASGLFTYSADVHYYQEFTPKLERDAQRAGELQTELLEPKRKWIWERR